MNIYIHTPFAPVAQLVEQWPLKPLVEGSSPSRRTPKEIPSSSSEMPHQSVGHFCFILIQTYIKYTQKWDTKSGTHFLNRSQFYRKRQTGVNLSQ